VAKATSWSVYFLPEHRRKDVHSGIPPTRHPGRGLAAKAACGVGEPPTISATPAIASAIRAATGLELPRVPIRPEHITGT